MLPREPEETQACTPPEAGVGEDEVGGGSGSRGEGGVRAQRAPVLVSRGGNPAMEVVWTTMTLETDGSFAGNVSSRISSQIW